MGNTIKKIGNTIFDDQTEYISDAFKPPWVYWWSINLIVLFGSVITFILASIQNGKDKTTKDDKDKTTKDDKDKTTTLNAGQIVGLVFFIISVISSFIYGTAFNALHAKAALEQEGLTGLGQFITNTFGTF